MKKPMKKEFKNFNKKLILAVSIITITSIILTPVIVLFHEFGHVVGFSLFGCTSYVFYNDFFGIFNTTIAYTVSICKLTTIQHFIVNILGPVVGFLFGLIFFISKKTRWIGYTSLAITLPAFYIEFYSFNFFTLVSSTAIAIISYILALNEIFKWKCMFKKGLLKVLSKN